MDTNVTGTLTLLEEAVAAGVESFVFTSTTSVFGRALTPITEDVAPVPRNIYGVTKRAAEDLCEIISRDHGLPVVVLRVSRFFPEGDDRDEIRAAYPDANVKANEYLNRRVDIQDVVDAHLLAVAQAPQIGFARFIISATTPFTPSDAAGLGWTPCYDFRYLLDQLKAGRDPRSPLACTVGAKGYHPVSTGPYTVR